MCLKGFRKLARVNTSNPDEGLVLNGKKTTRGNTYQFNVGPKIKSLARFTICWLSFFTSEHGLTPSRPCYKVATSWTLKHSLEGLLFSPKMSEYSFVNENRITWSINSLSSISMGFNPSLAKDSSWARNDGWIDKTMLTCRIQ